MDTNTREPLDFETFRQKVEAQRPGGAVREFTDEELRERLRSLRPDFAGTAEPKPRREERRDTLTRLRLLSYLGEALRAGVGVATETGISVAFEKLYRLSHEADPESPTIIDPEADPVAAMAILDAGIITVASMLLRLVRSAANPAFDREEERRLFANVTEERMQYFRDVRSDLSGAILHLDSILSAQIPGGPAYLARQEEAIATRTPAPEEDDSEPEEAPSVEMVSESIRAALQTVLGGTVEVEVIPEGLTARQDRRREPSED